MEAPCTPFHPDRSARSGGIRSTAGLAWKCFRQIQRNAGPAFRSPGVGLGAKQSGWYDQGMHVLVYSATWCRDCREAKRFLEKHQIPYTEIDIETSPGAADEVIRQVGKRAIPQFVVDGKWIQPYRPGRGFLHQEMTEFFQLQPARLTKPRKPRRPSGPGSFRMLRASTSSFGLTCSCSPPRPSAIKYCSVLPYQKAGNPCRVQPSLGQVCLQASRYRSIVISSGSSSMNRSPQSSEMQQR